MKKLWHKFWIWLGGEVVSPPSFSPPRLSDTGAATLPTQPPSVSSGKPATKIAIVREGDTLFSLAQKHNVSVQAITQVNHLDKKAQLHIGQKLTVPVFSPTIPPSEPPKQPVAYRVRQNDTVKSVARKFDLPAETLIAENKIAAPEKLISGQWLLIPAISPEADVPATATPENTTLPPVQARPTPPPSIQPEIRANAAKPTPHRLPSGKIPARGAPKPKLQPKPVRTPRAASAPAARKDAQLPGAQAKLSPKRKKQTAVKKHAASAPHLRSKSDDAPLPTKKQQTGKASRPAGLQKTTVLPETASVPDRLSVMPDNAVQGLYLAHHALNNQADHAHLIQLLRTTNINAVVIDFKDDWGYLSYLSNVPLAKTIGANKLTVHTLPTLLQTLKASHIRTIARIVTFKDNALASAHPELAAKRGHSSQLWRDAQHNAWVDPFQQITWAYNLEIAVKASQLGFDEILFDSARFPRPGLNGQPLFSSPLTMKNRLNAITGFLSAAYGQLAPLGVKVGATLTGYACWRYDDTLVGQNIERMAPYLDVLYPYLFPGAFSNGIPGIRRAIASPYEIVAQSAKQAVERTKKIHPACQLRPWLQDFQDSQRNGQLKEKSRPATDIQAQIRGVFDGGASGFIAWDPKTAYTEMIACQRVG